MTLFHCTACKCSYETEATGQTAQKEIAEHGWRIERWNVFGWGLICYDCREKNRATQVGTWPIPEPEAETV